MIDLVVELANARRLLSGTRDLGPASYAPELGVDCDRDAVLSRWRERLIPKAARDLIAKRLLVRAACGSVAARDVEKLRGRGLVVRACRSRENWRAEDDERHKQANGISSPGARYASILSKSSASTVAARPISRSDPVAKRGREDLIGAGKQGIYRAPTMGHESWHEPYEDLTPQTRDMHRAIISLMEELEAIDWYQQRADVTPDADLKAVMEHNRDEEIEHAMMTLEWIRRRSPKFDENLRTYLWSSGPITEVEEKMKDGGDGGDAKDAGEASSASKPEKKRSKSRPADGSLGVGGLGLTKEA